MTAQGCIHPRTQLQLGVSSPLCKLAVKKRGSVIGKWKRKEHDGGVLLPAEVDISGTMSIAAFTRPAVLPATKVSKAEIPHSTVNAVVSTLKSVVEAVTTSTSRVTALQSSVSTTTTVKDTTVSVTTGVGSTPPPTTATQKTTKGTTTQLPAEVVPTARNEDDNTTSTAQVSGTQATQNESVGAPSTKGLTLSPTTSPQKTTSASETSDLHGSTLTESATLDFVVTERNSGNTKMPEDTIHYSSVILPIVIALIVITLSGFSLVALYRMCHKKTPERQENGTEQAQSDKEGVKLLSVKTTSPETGEQSSQGKNKTRQCDDSSSHLSNKYM